MKLHIYLDLGTKEQLQQIRQKYKVSLSTIVDVLLNNVGFFYLKQDEYKEKYIWDGVKEQTCIVINRENKERFMYGFNINQNELSKIASNLCYEIAKDYSYMRKVIQKEEINKIKMNVNNELAKKREIYWDYNKTYRQHVRAQKQYRKEYETE